MKELLLVSIGSFFGGGMRVWISKMVQSYTFIAFPFGTMTVNVLGCFIIGFLSGFKLEWRRPFIPIRQNAPHYRLLRRFYHLLYLHERRLRTDEGWKLYLYYALSLRKFSFSTFTRPSQDIIWLNASHEKREIHHMRKECICIIEKKKIYHFYYFIH